MQIARYFHTLRFLKWSQIYWRLFYRFTKARLNLSEHSELRVKVFSWIKSIDKPIKMVGGDRFQFLNETHEIRCASDWNETKISKLWLYNLHYFDDLCAVEAKARCTSHKALIARWVAENPPGCGNGWEPYPLSLRICNWIKWVSSGNQLENEWLHSLAIQVRLLSNKLEWHILGNHLFANAKALIFAGLFFKGKEAGIWLDTGLAIIDKELDEQILPDGGHFELSPMYHSIILEDILDLINILQVYNKDLPQKWLEKAIEMLAWLEVMTHPDGQIALFNDAAFDTASSSADLLAYASTLGVLSTEHVSKPLTYLSESGYIRVNSGMCSAYLDVGRIGPDYLPGHAHADSLNFELSLERQRVFVDSGTSEYGVSEERSRQRSTQAHNTVCIDQENSSEVWGGFRVARRAKTYDVEYEDNAGLVLVSAKHDGYSRLSGKPVHQRQWQFSEGSLIVRDILTGSGYHRVGINWHVHPSFSVKLSGQFASIFNDEGSEICRLEVDSLLNVRLCNSTYHPQFGVQLDNIRIACEYEGHFPVKFMNTISWQHT